MILNFELASFKFIFLLMNLASAFAEIAKNNLKKPAALSGAQEEFSYEQLWDQSLWVERAIARRISTSNQEPASRSG